MVGIEKELLSPLSVKKAFESRGVSIYGWAQSNGFSPQLVYRVLNGESPCLRGQSREIGIRLGVVSEEQGSTDTFEAWLQEAKREKASQFFG